MYFILFCNLQSLQMEMAMAMAKSQLRHRNKTIIVAKSVATATFSYSSVRVFVSEEAFVACTICLSITRLIRSRRQKCVKFLQPIQTKTKVGKYQFTDFELCNKICWNIIATECCECFWLAVWLAGKVLIYVGGILFRTRNKWNWWEFYLKDKLLKSFQPK